MSVVGSGAFVGALAGTGCVLLVLGLAARRRPALEQRVAPYLGPPSAARADGALEIPFGSAVRRVLLPSLRSGGRRLDRVLGGSASLRERLVRAGSGSTLEQFRLEQLIWSAAAFGATFAVLVLALAGGSSLPAVAALILCVAAGVGGIVAREQVLDHQVRRRADRVAAEFPAIAELLALAVAAGEGASGSLERVTRVCHGDLARELERALEDTRTGRGLEDALRALARRLQLRDITRFVDTVSIAVERGTPLADVLRAQAADARESRRRALMESAGRREIAMLVPVVFLILPLTVLFALFPGFYGLSLSVG